MSGSTGEPTHATLSGEFVRALSALFESLGCTLICLDREFRVVHASEGLDGLAGGCAAGSVIGRPVTDILGSELSDEAADLRRALEAGERGEGRSAALRVGSAPSRLMSVTVAPVGTAADSPLCDPRVTYLLVVRPAAAAGETGREAVVARGSHEWTAGSSEERERLEAALQAHRWNRAATARALGISRTTLWRRMRELGLKF